MKEGERDEGNSRRRNGADDQKVQFYKLFSFADRLDVVLMIVGTIGAIANGLAQPLMTLIFGQLINSFGSSDQSNVVHDVSKVHPARIRILLPFSRVIVILFRFDPFIIIPLFSVIIILSFYVLLISLL